MNTTNTLSNAALEQESKRARQLFHSKKNKPEFEYFTSRGIDYFTNWFLQLDRKCCYCQIEEYKLRELFLSGRLSSKRKRGRSLELERFDSTSNLYTETNCALACYFCNNHKSDIITQDEHKAYFSKPIRSYINDLHGYSHKLTDADTNFLYLADTLPAKYPSFYQRFEQVLTKNHVRYGFLPNTKDIWAVDYMPIQVQKDKFVQFVYNPDYLQPKVWQKTISDTHSICNAIGITPVKSDIKVDGGNVVRSKTKAILCDKVFRENSHVPEHELIIKLKELLEVEQLILIPTDPKDFTGHADGLVRFMDERTVLINDQSMEKTGFGQTLKTALYNAGLDWIEIPYNPYNNQKNSQANGVYINYLQMQGMVILPTFGLKEDELVVRKFEQLFTGSTIATVDSNDIADQGGILNCISFNIKKTD